MRDLYADLSREEEAMILSKAIATITKYSGEDGYDVKSEISIAGLRRLQRNLRWQERLEL